MYKYRQRRQNKMLKLGKSGPQAQQHSYYSWSFSLNLLVFSKMKIFIAALLLFLELFSEFVSFFQNEDFFFNTSPCLCSPGFSLPFGALTSVSQPPEMCYHNCLIEEQRETLTTTEVLYRIQNKDTRENEIKSIIYAPNTALIQKYKELHL